MHRSYAPTPFPSRCVFVFYQFPVIHLLGKYLYGSNVVSSQEAGALRGSNALSITCCSSLKAWFFLLPPSWEKAAENNSGNIPKCLDWLAEQDSWTTVPSTAAILAADTSPKGGEKGRRKKTKKKERKIQESARPSQTVPEIVHPPLVPQQKTSRGEGQGVDAGTSSSNSTSQVPPSTFTFTSTASAPTPRAPTPDSRTPATANNSADTKTNGIRVTPPKVTFARILAGGAKKRTRTQSEPSRHVSFNLDVNDVLLYTPNQSPQVKKKNSAKKERRRPVQRRFDGSGFSVQEHLKQRRRRTSSCSALPTDAPGQCAPKTGNPDTPTNNSSEGANKTSSRSWMPIVVSALIAIVAAILRLWFPNSFLTPLNELYSKQTN